MREDHFWMTVVERGNSEELDLISMLVDINCIAINANISQVIPTGGVFEVELSKDKWYY